MMRFRYIVEDAQGNRREGEVSADNYYAAREQLREQGLRLILLGPTGDGHGASVSKLSQKEAEEVVIAIAELSHSELPLVEGLRAAADESVSSRVARALRQIAGDVEQGYALDSVMGERGKFLPPHVRGLVAAASRTQRMGVALDDLVEHHRATREVWGKVLGAIAYPLIVMGMTLFILAFLPIFIVPEGASSEGKVTGGALRNAQSALRCRGWERDARALLRLGQAQQAVGDRAAAAATLLAAYHAGGDPWFAAVAPELVAWVRTAAAASPGA